MNTCRLKPVLQIEDPKMFAIKSASPAVKKKEKKEKHTSIISLFCNCTNYSLSNKYVQTGKENKTLACQSLNVQTF